MHEKLGYILLAAGKGTRMHSDSPKVLQTVLGKPLLGYVFDALRHVPPRQVWTVVGFRADEVRATFSARDVRYVLQEEQLGTGHAVALAWPEVVLSGLTHVCVLNGDTPYVPVEEVERLAALCGEVGAAMGMLTLELENPFGYGRVVRSPEGAVLRVVEEKDFDVEKHGSEIHEVNSGVYIFDVARCTELLSRMDRDNAQGEFYLTQMISLCAESGQAIVGVPFGSSELLRGINSPAELIEFEEALRSRIVDGLIQSGVIVRQGNSVVIGPDVEIAPGVEIVGPCEIYGRTSIGRGARISSHCLIRDAVLGSCQVKSFSHIEGARVGDGANIGPFARLRPGSDIGCKARVGNFVEVKNAILREGAKAGHLSYLGDSDIGSGVNIGAGTITCNYDGVRKHRTEIRDNAFIGSNTALVAPVVVGEGALVGAGSVVTKDVPDRALCVARARQTNIERKKRDTSPQS